MHAPTSISIADAYKVCADLAQTSWQRSWDCDSKGRCTYGLIPEVSTKILWPRKREVEVSYCRIPLNTDAFRTAEAESLICACKTDKETVEHVLFHCANHDNCITQLMDVVDDICISVTAENLVHINEHVLIAPNSSGFVTKYENCTLKKAFFSIFSHH